MKPISFIIHYRKDSQDRHRNLVNVLNYYGALNCEFIIINDDSVNRYNELKPFLRSNDKFFFLPNEGQYVRTLAFNFGATVATHDVLCFQDTDTIVSKVDLTETAEKITSKSVVANPHNGFFINIPEDLVSSFSSTLQYSDFQHATSSVRPILGSTQGKFYVMGTKSVGGSVLFNKGVFIAIGGYAPMIGWGYEDNEIIERVGKLNLNYILGTMPIFHMTHFSNSRGENPFIANNKTIYDECKNTSGEAFSNYVQKVVNAFGLNLEQIRKKIIKVQ